MTPPPTRRSRTLLHLGRTSVATAVVALVSGGAGASPAGPEPVPWFETGDRAAVVAAYEAEFGVEVPPIDWNGGDGPCDAGASSPGSRAATLARVNYYRAMAGVAAVVSEEPALSAKAQLAAMMMSAQGELTHTPAPTFACFTTGGQEAARNSNLYLGRTGPEAIDGYIEDPGGGNTDVGHRTTILHPPTLEMGVGDVGYSAEVRPANALWVFDERVFDSGPAPGRPPMREPGGFVAWPPRGYVPPDLVHPRWSFTLAGADLAGAEVVMSRPWAPPGEREVPLRVVSRTGAPGRVPLPTIVWEPEITLDPATDSVYLVTIRGIRPAAGPGGGGVAPVASVTPTPGTGIQDTYTYEVRVLGG